MNNYIEYLRNEGFRKYFFNTSWLFATHGVRIAAGFFVGLWVARYLGPNDFGSFNYVISFIAIFSAFSSFGTNEQLVSDLVRWPERSGQILCAAFYLRLTLGLMALLVIGLISLTGLHDKITTRYIFLCFPVIFFQSFDLIDVYYRATVRAKTSSIVRIVQVIVSSLIKIYLIYSKAPLLYFFYIFTFDYLSYGVLIYSSFRKIHQGFLLQKPDLAEIKRIINLCWPLMLIIVSHNLLSKLDQVLIGQFLDRTEVGFYSSSSRIVELLGTIPTIMLASLYTAILNAKKNDNSQYYNRLVSLSRFLIIMSVGSALFISFFSLEIITLLFGKDYESAAGILRIQSFSFIFYSMSVVSTHWYIAEGLNKLLMTKTLLTSIFSISLNLFLIPRYGVNGAVYTTLLTYVLFYYFYDLINPRTRKIFFINTGVKRN